MRSGCYLFAVRKSRWIRRRLKSIRDEMGDITNRCLFMLLRADVQTQQAMLGGNHVWQHLYIIYLTYWLTNSNTVRTSMRLTHARAARTRCTHLLDDAERAAAGLRLHHAANRATWAEQQLHQTANTQTHTGACHQGRWRGSESCVVGWAAAPPDCKHTNTGACSAATASHQGQRGGGLFESLAVVKQSWCKHGCDQGRSRHKPHGTNSIRETARVLRLLYLILCRSFMILNPESTFGS